MGVTRTAASEGSDAASNPNLAASIIEYSLYDQALRTAASWRRATFLVALLAFAVIGIAMVLATKDHSEAIIYREDPSGDLALIGTSAGHSLPSDESVKHQLAAWIVAVRTIAPDDPDLANVNAITVRSMVQRDSDAETDYYAFIRQQNPLKLGKNGWSITVRKAEVVRLAALTYRIAWVELWRQRGSAAVEKQFDGTVTLAAPPAAPTDPVIGQANPAGVFIKSYDMAWGFIPQQ